MLPDLSIIFSILILDFFYCNDYISVTKPKPHFFIEPKVKLSNVQLQLFFYLMDDDNLFFIFGFLPFICGNNVAISCSTVSCLDGCRLCFLWDYTKLTPTFIIRMYKQCSKLKIRPISVPHSGERYKNYPAMLLVYLWDFKFVIFSITKFCSN